MAQSKTTWGVGDYPRMALELEPVASSRSGIAFGSARECESSILHQAPATLHWWRLKLGAVVTGGRH